ncbi:hypothetical protein PWEIH_03606 [Listeria weihenstephanensis FSL R9-0317]|uniref:Uncharacterized protein n=1 Tax=Listeria weihenstephanensis TaxID=1006155 RepID=A0A1S7FVY7_9LIST|nr:transposon-transfer assisting family protein [Listeria weihenstephanensis]AQY51559.1 hypothetical protein UE46_11285 [Listeria weihenstephanensis]EUJ40611.1 hypothetical protein PWEIH_03606 [Listeria weihenstephanensis FSL R9-0317]
MDLFTLEEQNLLAAYDVSSRMNLLQSLEDALPYVYDYEMMGLINGIIGKLLIIDDDVFELVSFDYTEYYEAKND